MADVLRATADHFGGPTKRNGPMSEIEFSLWPVCCLD